jgi:hypothetical protein
VIRFALGFATATLLAILTLPRPADAGPPDPQPVLIVHARGLLEALPLDADERTIQAFLLASKRHNVSPGLLACIGWVEARWDSEAVGDHGNSVGQVQIHRLGLLRDFHQSGYDDPRDAVQAYDYLASWIARDRAFVARNWAGWRLCR